MKNLEPISRIYFLLFAGVTGLIILMMLCGCNPTNGSDTRLSYEARSVRDTNGHGGVFIFVADAPYQTNDFDVFRPVNGNGRWIRLDRTCDAKAYLSQLDGYPEQWR